MSLPVRTEKFIRMCLTNAYMVRLFYNKITDNTNCTRIKATYINEKQITA